MDPKAALIGALSCFFNLPKFGELLEGAEKLGAYQEWRAGGGYEPELDRDCDEVKQFASLHPGVILDADHIAANLASDYGTEVEKNCGFYVERFDAKTLDRISNALDGEDESDDEIEARGCPACENEDGNMLLGVLGSRVHCRCRACGIDFNFVLGGE